MNNLKKFVFWPFPFKFWDFVLTFIIAVMVDPEMIFPQSGAIVTGVGQYVGKNGGVILVIFLS